MPTNSADCVDDPPNHLHTVHVAAAFLAAAAGTKLPDNADRSIGLTYHVGTAGNNPYMAAGIVTSTTLSLLMLRTYASLINNNRDIFSSLAK